MANNIEIKARVEDVDDLQLRAVKLSDTSVQILEQVDTFFSVPRGRLKLRVFPDNLGQLIFYQRSDQEGPKDSEYHIYETSDPETLKQVLSCSFGIRGVVSKTRLLYLVGPTRIHIDTVENLGTFMELEVVLNDSLSESEGMHIAEDLMRKLGIKKDHLVSSAYIDLLEKNVK